MLRRLALRVVIAAWVGFQSWNGRAEGPTEAKNTQAERILRLYADRDLLALQMHQVEYESLPLSERNRVALAAAKSLSIESYLKPAGIEVKAGENVLYQRFTQPSAQDTPAEAECRRQWGINMHAADTLRNLAEERLINESQVLPYLIAALDHPDRGSVGQPCFYALMNLTRRQSGHIYWSRLVWNEARHAEVSNWWRQWWDKNRQRHLILDAEVENAARNEVLRLSRKIESVLKPKFPELAMFKTPAEMPLTWQRPLFYIEYDPSRWALPQGMFDKFDRKELPWVLVCCRSRSGDLPDKDDHERGPMPPKELSNRTKTCYSKVVLNSDLLVEVIVASPKQNLIYQAQALFADVETPPRPAATKEP